MIAVRFNGTELTKLWAVGNIKRPLPEFVPSSSSVDGRDGKIFDNQVIGTRGVAFDIIASGSTDRALQDEARKLLGVLSVRTPAQLTFSDERDADNVQLVRYAVPTGAFDAEEFKRLGKWRCEFLMHDPYLYGKQRTVTLKAEKGVKVSAGGNAEAYPVAKARVGSGDLYAVRIINGRSIAYSAPFNNNDIVVDMERQTVSVNPEPVGASGIRAGSRFFSIKGTVDLRASHDTELTWRERWL